MRVAIGLDNGSDFKTLKLYPHLPVIPNEGAKITIDKTIYIVETVCYDFDEMSVMIIVKKR
jgi:hypothetical protein